MLRNILAAAALVVAITGWSCTSFIVGKKASADGSAMITYAADSHTLYGDIIHKPAADHPAGSVREVVDWDSNRPLCTIPQVPHTYAVTGNMNEHGLAISESTWGGREDLWGSEGIDYGSLIYIALERCRTPREAIKVMTDLANTYGYASEGESFSLTDGNEAWILELIGKGKYGKGVVWVARRIPDDAISGHANHPRIHKFPLKDKETLYAPDVIKFARERGWFDGKDQDFDFSRTYAVTDEGATRGCDSRVWSFFRANSADKDAMDAYLPWILHAEGEPFPLWIKPDKPLTVRDMHNAMRDHFEGTALDMTKDIGAGPFTVPYRWRPMTYKVDGKTYTHERATATQQTGFSFVAQCNAEAPAPRRCTLWFGADDTNTCVYVPIFSGADHVPYQFARGNGDMYNISWDAAFWVNNYVANQAYNRYSQMIPDIRRVQNAQEDLIADETAALIAQTDTVPADEAAKQLAEYSDKAAARYVKAYKELGDYLLVKYLDGNIKKEKDGKFAVTEYGVPVSPVFGGYSDEYYRNIATSPDGPRLEIKE